MGKVCSVCRIYKQDSDFYKDNQKKDGLTYRCKLCCAVDAKKYRTDNREKVNSKTNEYKRNNADKIRISNKIYRENNIEKERKRTMKHRKENIEKYNAYANEYRASHPVEIRAYRLKKDFGMSVNEYEQMLEKQGGVCAICKQAETRIHCITKKVIRFCVDHDHKTGKIRGLLCTRCNLMIGHVNDNAPLLREAADYIDR